MATNLDVIKKIISERTGIEPEEIHTDSYFEDDLNIGEIELLDIISDIEETFEIELDSESTNFDSVQDVLDTISEYLD